MALELTDANFEELVMKSDKPVLVDFWAVWCGPCRMVGPIVEEIANDYEGKAIVGKVDVDNNPEVASKFDACYSFATCTGRFVGYYGTTFSPILICIASGYYLFRK